MSSTGGGSREDGGGQVRGQGAVQGVGGSGEHCLSRDRDGE